MKFFNNFSINDELTVKQFAQSVTQNLVEALHAMQELQNQTQ
jgi:hypothetical protein